VGLDKALALAEAHGHDMVVKSSEQSDVYGCKHDVCHAKITADEDFVTVGNTQDIQIACPLR
jgi:hypothetical protein